MIPMWIPITCSMLVAIDGVLVVTLTLVARMGG